MTKHWSESLTIRGQILQALPALYAVARATGFDLPDGILEALLNGIAAIIFLVGMVASIMGRFRADKGLHT